MFGGNLSEESDDEKIANESDYEVSESSSDGDGDDDGDGSSVNKGKSTMITRGRESRDKSVIISISEKTKSRDRNSGITIREPTDSSLLASFATKRKRSTGHRLPAKRFKDPIVGSSSSAANNVSFPVSTEITSQSQVNVNGGTITTVSPGSGANPSSVTSQVNVNGGTITESWSIPLTAATVRLAQVDGFTSWNIQESIFGSSSGSNNTRPNSLILGSSSSSGVEAQAEANITRPSTSSQPLLLPAIPNYQQQQPPPSYYSMVPQHYLTRMAPQETAMQRQLLPILPSIPMRNSVPNAVPVYSQAQMEAMTSWLWSLLPYPSWNLHGPNFVLGIQGNITRPSSVDPHSQNSVSGPISSTTLSSGSSVQAQSNVIRAWPYGIWPAMPNYQQQHHLSSPLGELQYFRQEAPLMQDVRGLELNLLANIEDDAKKDEGLDLNLPANNEDEEENEGLDLNLRLGMND